MKMNCILKLFKSNQDEIHIGTSELSNRILEIQRRIAFLRSNLEIAEQPCSTAPVLTEPVVAISAETNKQSKDQEIMMMKAKLLGKKI